LRRQHLLQIPEQRAHQHPSALAPELPPIPQIQLQRKYREEKKLRPKKFVPQMDVAASWMFNPC
jgi:hypothetical protein